MTSFAPEYRDFEEYRDERLSGKSPLEQLLLMDSELANYVHLSRYIGPLHPADLPELRSAYDDRFSKFMQKRLTEIGDTNDRQNHTEFADFREDIAVLNKELTNKQHAEVQVLSESAERLLTKRLRREGLDPSQMNLDYMSRDGTLYLLELYATAVQQESTTTVICSPNFKQPWMSIRD